MLNNFFKFTFRTFLKNRTFTILNILGLSVGLAASILIFLFVNHELSFDKFHTDGDRIYRIYESFTSGDSYTTTALTPYMVAPLSQERFSGIESYQRMFYPFGSLMNAKRDDLEFEITGQYTFTDPDFFNFFSFELLQGNKDEVLASPNSLVISQSGAEKLFGEEDPIGKTVSLVYIYENRSFDMQVSGVMADFPQNSHFRYDYLMPLDMIVNMAPQMKESWGWTSQHTYIKMKEGADPSLINRQSLKELTDQHAPEYWQELAYLGIQPMLDIHLRSHLKEELAVNGDITYVRIFSVIAIFIVLIACINYMNLSTSLAARRGKEVGLKKVVGASRGKLITQFLGESLLMVLISFVFALTLAQSSLPYFNQLTGYELDLLSLEKSYYVVGAVIILFIALLAGSYPAFLLSSMRTLVVLKGNDFKIGRSVSLRKVLVIVQFSISIMLITSTVIIYNQWVFMRNQDLGVNTEGMVLVPFKTQESIENYELFKAELSKQSQIKSVAAASKGFSERFDGFINLEKRGSKEMHSFAQEFIDVDFFKTLEVEMLSGRGFSKEYAGDSARIIINQAAAASLGFDDPIGKVLTSEGYTYEIVGLVKDFHYETLHHKIVPLIFRLTRYSMSQAFIKIKPDDRQTALSIIEDAWTKLGLVQDFEYEYLETAKTKSYLGEARFMNIFSLFTVLAIFIACLGIFGLAAFTAERRIKEIGIRKVLGATTQQIMLLLSTEFIKLVILANIVAWPVAFFLMSGWLEEFAYRITLTPGVFLIGGFLGLIVAVLAVSSQSLKAAMANPADSLKYE